MRTWKPALVLVVILLLVGIFATKAVRLLRAGQDAVRIEQSLDTFLRKSNAPRLMIEGPNPNLSDLVKKNMFIRDVQITGVEIQKHGQAATIKVATSSNVEYEYSYNVNSGLVNYAKAKY